MDWCFKACEIDHESLMAHINLRNIFEKLNFYEADILAAMKKYQKLDTFMFYYKLGMAYYDKKQYANSIKWY
jgi:hypothetical protein